MAADYVGSLGRGIRYQREQRGMSRADLAREMPGKTNENAVYRWENGQHRPHDDTLEALARVLGLTTWTRFLDLDPERQNGAPAETPDPFPARPIEGELAGILDDIKTQLADQTEVLKDIQREQATLKKLIAAEKTARTEAETARTRLLEAAEVASRAYEDAARRLAKAPGTQAT